MTVADDEPTIRIWRTNNGVLDNVINNPNSNPGSWYVAYSPDGKTIATADRDYKVRLFDSTTGALKQTLSGHTSFVYGVAFSPDGKYLASAGSFDRTVRIWDLATNKQVFSLAHANTARVVRFSPDSTILAAASDDRLIKLWNVADGKLIRNITGHTNVIWGLDFSPDGKLLASGSSDLSARIWTVADGKISKTLTDPTGPVYDLTFSKDGSVLAVSGGSQRVIHLYETATWTRTKQFTGHTFGNIFAVGISPNGMALYTTSDDRTMRYYNVADTMTSRVVYTNSERHFEVTTSPKGKWMAAASVVRSEVRLWQVGQYDQRILITAHPAGWRRWRFLPTKRCLQRAEKTEPSASLTPPMVQKPKNSWVTNSRPAHSPFPPMERPLHRPLGIARFDFGTLPMAR